MIKINIQDSVRIKEESYSMFISFEYDNKIVSVIRSLPIRYWNKDTKEWEVPVNKLDTLLTQLPEQEFDITGKYIKFEKPDAKVPEGFKFKTTPFQHQIEGFNYGLAHDRWLLGDEQGLGKTKQVIDIAVAKKIQHGYKHCLIVCGVNGLKWNWKNEITTHSNETGYILGERRTKTSKKVVVGSTKDKLDDLNNLDNISSYFLITNVESLRDEKVASKLQELCKSKEIGVCAIDEIHKCKNPSSQQGKGILKLTAPCRIAMTGTPLMNTPMDLFIILKWLGFESHAFYSFKKHYCVMGGYGGYEIIGYRNLDQLQSRLNDIMLRRLKADVLDLPEKLYIDEYVEMTAKQENIYNEVTEEIKSNIDKIATSPNPLALLIRMRQATGYTGILSSVIQESSKMDRMEELVEESVANGKKVVVFSNWTQMTEPIRQRLSKYNPALITGEISADDRQIMVNKFQNDSSCKVIVGTIGAMGTGLTLTAGTVEIFMDEPWTMAAKDQAVDRCHRIGAKENVTVYTLMCQGTVDERIHQLVEEKGAMSDAIVDNKIVGNKAELLDFLLS